MNGIKCFVLTILLLFAKISIADTLTVVCNHWGIDDRFYKYEITLPLFLTQHDTIRTLTFENLFPAKNIIIKKPEGYVQYGYGFIFFPGAIDAINPGYTSVLVCNPYARNPKMIIDENHNYDFTDDLTYALPYFNENGIELDLNNSSFSLGKNRIRITRNYLFNKADYRKYMDEYYAYFYKDRKFCGMDYSYRIQHHIVRSGIVRINNDSFRIGLYDANKNGLFNDADTDKVMLIQYNDSIFDATSDIGSCTLKNGAHQNFIERNGFIFEIASIDSFGNHIQLIPTAGSDPKTWKYKTGKRIPRMKFTLYDASQLKLRKLRKQKVLFYFNKIDHPALEKDTLLLRQIAAIDTNKIRVIVFLWVDRSYELRIYGSQSKANYYVALGNKEIAKKLGIKGLPQTMYLNKRRRLIAYHKSLEEILNENKN